MDIFAFDKAGIWTEVAGEFSGKDSKKDFAEFMEQLEQKGHLSKTEDYPTSVPHCERCNTRVEPLVSKQRFVDVKEYAEQSINAVKT